MKGLGCKILACKGEVIVKIKSYPVLDYQSIQDSNNVFLNLEKFSAFAMQDSSVLNNIESRFSTSKTLFNLFLCSSTPQAFKVSDNCYCIYLPVGFENLTETEVDRKGVIDFFPKESYSYHYYKERGFIDKIDQNKIDWSKYSDFLSWNKTCLKFLGQIMDKITVPNFLNSKERNNWLIRLIYYPPVASANYLRLAEHIDDDVLTMVMSNDFSSLEVKDESGKFTKLSIPADSFIVLAGSCLEHITQGKIKGLPHHVVGGDFYMNSRYIFSFHLGANLNTEFVETHYQNILKEKYFLAKT